MLISSRLKKKKAFVIIPGDTKLYQWGFWHCYRRNKKQCKLRQSEDSRSLVTCVTSNHLGLTSSKNKIEENVKTALKRIWWKTINLVICWTLKYWSMCHALFFKTFFLSGNPPNVYISYTCSIKIIKLNFFSFLLSQAKIVKWNKPVCYMISRSAQLICNIYSAKHSIFKFFEKIFSVFP